MSDEINAGTGPNIVLRDHEDTPVEHEFPANLQVDTADGGTTKYVHESLVAEPVETTVELDFSGGDMVITPDAGQVFSAVNIPKPANLIADNIAEGVNIAGIVGAMAASNGGGEVKIQMKTVNITSTYADMAIGHSLGVTPDFLLMVLIGSFTSIGTYMIGGCSKAFIDKFGGSLFANFCASRNSTGQYNSFGSVPIDDFGGTIYMANASKFYVSQEIQNGQYNILAIAGLT